jgi:alanine dehydrogenase
MGRDHAQLLLLDTHVVQTLLTRQDALDAVTQAFTLHNAKAGRVFPVVREALATGGIFGIKSGDVETLDLLGFKAAGFWPNNRAQGGEPHQATIVLFDPHTGRPLCVIDGNQVTTLRTGAAGALGLHTLARRDSTRLCVFGSGVQATIQLSFALHVLPTLQMVRYVTADAKPDATFEAHFASQCTLEHTSNADDAVANSDVVITATPGKAPLFSAHAVQPGTHLNCVGADTKGKRELPDGVLPRARVVVDDATQARQLGELQWAGSDTPCIEIGSLITGQTPFERASTDITVFDMTGLALQDLTVARLLFARAQQQQVGARIAWPW